MGSTAQFLYRRYATSLEAFSPVIARDKIRQHLGGLFLGLDAGGTGVGGRLCYAFCHVPEDAVEAPNVGVFKGDGQEQAVQ